MRTVLPSSSCTAIRSSSTSPRSLCATLRGLYLNRPETLEPDQDAVVLIEIHRTRDGNATTGPKVT